MHIFLRVRAPATVYGILTASPRWSRVWTMRCVSSAPERTAYTSTDNSALLVYLARNLEIEKTFNESCTNKH